MSHATSLMSDDIMTGLLGTMARQQRERVERERGRIGMTEKFFESSGDRPEKREKLRI